MAANLLLNNKHNLKVKMRENGKRYTELGEIC
jgi:hypothetical protein